jgi:alpha-1,3-rhamnosyl/mannosyltransferase
VATVYDLSLRLLPETQPRVRVTLFERTFPASLPRMARFLAISELVKRQLCGTFEVDPASVSVTPLGYDAALFHPSPDSEVDDEPLPRRYLLAVGTLEPRKNAATLLAAYARLPRALRDEVPLLWAGALGWKSPPLQQLAGAHGVADHVRALGYVDDARLGRLYRRATAFVFPSLYEGFGLPVLEALACAAPTLCSDAEAVVELVGEAALVVAATDVDAWTAGLLRIVEDEPLRARLEAAGPARAREYSWERCARLTLAAYEQALADGG